MNQKTFARSVFWILSAAALGVLILSYPGLVVFDNTVGTIGFFEILEHILFIALLAAGSWTILSRQRGEYNRGGLCILDITRRSE